MLGILLLNIVSFGLPEASYGNPLAYTSQPLADTAAYLVNFLLFDGRMRGLFSFLFGASLLLVAERAGDEAARVHYRRMAWLLGFGLAHLLLVWHGDILAHYALGGMIAFSMRDLPQERMLVLGALLIVLATCLAALTQLTLVMLEAPGTAGDLAALEQRANPAPAALLKEIAHFRGDYLPMVRARLADEPGSSVNALILYGPETLAFMLFGMAALRSGMLGGRWPRVRYRSWLVRSWAATLPVYALLALYLVEAQFSAIAIAVAVDTIPIVLRPLAIAGWICLILLLVRPGSRVAARLAAAGRMAFTNYLATSFVCTAIFYGFGLGWFGTLARWELYPLVLVIWAAILGWSKPWLDRYRFGPFEWLWRSLARGALQPLRRSKRRSSANASQ